MQPPRRMPPPPLLPGIGRVDEEDLDAASRLVRVEWHKVVQHRLLVPHQLPLCHERREHRVCVEALLLLMPELRGGRGSRYHQGPCRSTAPPRAITEGVWRGGSRCPQEGGGPRRGRGHPGYPGGQPARGALHVLKLVGRWSGGDDVLRRGAGGDERAPRVSPFRGHPQRMVRRP